MSNFFVRSLLIISSVIFSANGFTQTINNSSPFELGFYDLPYDSFLGYQNSGSLGFSLDLIDQLDDGDIVRLEFFNDFNLTIPVSFGAIGYSVDFTSPTESFGVSVVDAFQNNQGGFRLTVLSGSIKLNSVFARALINGENYQTEIFKSSVSPVPEPESYAIMLMGIGMIGFVAKRRKNTQA